MNSLENKKSMAQFAKVSTPGNFKYLCTNSLENKKSTVGGRTVFFEWARVISKLR